MTRAPLGTAVLAVGPTAVMCLPEMMTVVSGALVAAPTSSGWMTVAPTIAMGGAGAAPSDANGNAVSSAVTGPRRKNCIAGFTFCTT